MTEPAEAASGELRLAWEERGLKHLRSLGRGSSGNRVELFADGDRAFAAMWIAIDAARERVWLETYTLAPDDVGRATLRRMAAAAERGCEVILLYDHAGSPRVSESFLEPLRQTGARVVAFNPLWPWRRKGPLAFRDHRKLLVADRSGFCGGMNISEDYAGDELGNSRFRDTVVRLEGPAVGDMARLFVRSLRETRAAPPAQPPEPAPYDDGAYVQVLTSNPRRRRRSIQRALWHGLRGAGARCYVTTPYFLPSRRVTRALTSAARRGVDVRVLTAGLSDVPIVRLAGRYLYGRFLRAGVRIFELFGRTLHAKTLTLDGRYSAVGSFNLDPLSDRLNLEMMVMVTDPGVAALMEETFQRDLETSKEISLAGWARRPLIERIPGWLAYQVLRA